MNKSVNISVNYNVLTLEEVKKSNFNTFFAYELETETVYHMRYDSSSDCFVKQVFDGYETEDSLGDFEIEDFVEYFLSFDTRSSGYDFVFPSSDLFKFIICQNTTHDFRSEDDSDDN